MIDRTNFQREGVDTLPNNMRYAMCDAYISPDEHRHHRFCLS